MNRTNTKKLTPERVIEILKKKGTVVTIEEAKVLLDFVGKIAHIAVNQYLSGRL